MHDILGDVRISLRQLARTPSFTTAAVVVLALGLGLNAGMFGLVHALAIAGRPFDRPEELVQLYSRHTSEVDTYRAFSYGAYQEIAARGDAFSGVLAHNLGMVAVSGGPDGEAQRMFAGFVSENYFELLGVPLVQGRAFTREECLPGREIPAAVVSHSLWRRLGARPDIVGQPIRVNERDFTVVGVAPRGFTGTMALFGPELFLPLGVFDSLSNDFSGAENRSLLKADAFNLFLVGRLKPGVSLAAAKQPLALTDAAVERAFPAEYRARQIAIAPLPRFGTSTSPRDESAVTAVAALLMGLTVSVLLIVCLNLATAQLARGQARRREFAVRLALGGGRSRIVRQLLIEGGLMAMVGGGLGIAIGVPAVDGFVNALLARLPVSLAVEARAPSAVVFGAAAMAVLATAAFALGPALKHSGADLMTDLRQQSGDVVITRRRRWAPRHPLVAAQVALSLALLIAAGLFLRMAQHAANVDVGVRADATVLAEVDASLAGYDEAQGLALYARIEERLRTMPGVQAAAVGVTVPFGMVSLSESMRRAGTAPPPGAKPSAPETGQAFLARWNAVGAAYFDAMGMRVLRGRRFSDVEALHPGALRVAIIDEVLARDLWPDDDPIGRAIEIAPRAGTSVPPAPMIVVGVVSLVRGDFFERTPGRAVYVPFAQSYRNNVHFHVRPASGDGGALIDGVRQAVQSAAPGLSIFRTVRFADHLDSSTESWGLKALATVVTTVGGFAAFIAVIGLYGAKSYAVSRRTREIGVRMAVGATPGSVRAMILREAMSLGAGGVALGLLLGLGVGRVLESVLVEVDAFDWATFTVTPALLLAACILAAWVPARRATAVDPSQALRAE